MTTPPNICLIGRAGAGKSTVADLLIERFGLGYERLSFAEPLKVGTGTRTDREVLQRVGQGVRDLCPDFWVNLAVYKLYKGGRDGPWVVDDCRYFNEYYKLLDNDFYVVRVTAPTDVRVERLIANGKNGGDLNAQSEVELDDVVVHHTLSNPDDDAERLERQVVRLMNLVR